MALSTIIKEVHRLNGKVVALRRFLSRRANKCKPFFQLLKSARERVVWEKECEEAFENLKCN